jgi:hypothetical protein
VSSDVGEVAGKVVILISVASEITKSAPEIERIIRSRDSWDIKGAKLSLQASGICSRVLLGMRTGMVHSGVWVARHTTWVDPLYWIDKRDFVRAVDSLDNMTSEVSSFWERLTVGDEFYNLIQLKVGKVVDSMIDQ